MKKKSIWKIAVLAVLAVAVIGLAGCGSKKDGEKTYTVVTEPTFAPFDTTNDSGKIVGFDMDLMNAIAKDQGFKVKYKSLEFDALIPAIQSKQADIIAAGMNADDPARQKKVDFSDTYYQAGLVVLVSKDSSIASVDNFTPDMKVAAQIGTTSADKAQELKKDGKISDAVILNKNTEAVQQLENGDVQAVIIDKPVAESFISKDAHKDKIKIVGDTMNAEHYGFAVHKGNTKLLKKINAGLKNVKDDGTYDKIHDKWFK